MPKLTKKKTVLGSQARELVVRLRDYFEREQQNNGPLLPLNRIVERVAEALDIGRNTVSRITREKIGQEGMSENKLSTPNKKRTKVKPITDLDNFGKDAIRNHIYDYYRRMELPTLLKLLKSLKEADLFKGVQVNKPPNQSNRKSELVKWLSENGVTADITMLKTELIALVRRHKPLTPTYALDEMAKEKGYQVLRLPSYHCQYNAIELIWSQIKEMDPGGRHAGRDPPPGLDLCLTIVIKLEPVLTEFPLCYPF
ncbi:hypothetical protein EVAR_102501_1 [Eumeta japonica]|uniref:Tc1-like transposase DDE domain-containing protein n=1 Tax=Eumeta variegata TaxID=151549 RepID=A0A4C1ZKW2_EUMVA|nr:hypothetical protein EVAR_102501_1 [Eumeta japonica]